MSAYRRYMIMIYPPVQLCLLIVGMVMIYPPGASAVMSAYCGYVTEMRERLSVNPLTILYSSKSVKYISLTLELATCTHTYFVHVIGI